MEIYVVRYEMRVLYKNNRIDFPVRKDDGKNIWIEVKYFD